MSRMTMNKLAAMMQDGFNHLHEAMQKGFDKIGVDIALLKSDVGILKTDVGLLKQDMEDVKLRLDQKANKIDLDELSRKFDQRFPG